LRINFDTVAESQLARANSGQIMAWLIRGGGLGMIEWSRLSKPELFFIAIILFGVASVWTGLQWGLLR
jgi:hypothetical protein